MAEDAAKFLTLMREACSGGDINMGNIPGLDVGSSVDQTADNISTLTDRRSDVSLGLAELVNGFGSANMFACNFTIKDAFDSVEFDVLRRPAFAAVIVAVYSVVIAFGLFGNALVFLTVVRNPRMHTSTNIFIANLALADIFVCAFDLPLNLYYQLSDDWVFGSVLCHVIPVLLGVVLCASTLTLTVIAADRFALIVVGVRRRMSPALAMILIGLIVVVSTLVSLPVAIVSRVETYMDRRYCVEKWPVKPFRFFRHLYTAATVVIQYFLPLTIIGILYLLVFRHVRASRKQTGRRRVVSKTNRMLVAVVAVFAVAWSPYQLMSLLIEFHPTAVSGPYVRFIDLITRVVGMASSGLNPVLYGWMNNNFRSAFLGIFRGRQLAIVTTTAIGDGTVAEIGGGGGDMSRRNKHLKASALCANEDERLAKTSGSAV